MELTEIVGFETTPEGEELLLVCRDSVYTLRVNGIELMTSRAHGSEEDLARLACREISDRTSPRVLIGGLGFGFTLRAALEALPEDATVVLCEFFATLLEWNRGPLGKLAGRPLKDSRVTALHADVRTALGDAGTFDVIILDVDNGPWGFTLQSNNELYSAAGIDRLAQTLAPAGVLAVWSSEPSPEFVLRLEQGGFDVRVETVSTIDSDHEPLHTIFVAKKR
jgi:spermidine synthase